MEAHLHEDDIPFHLWCIEEAEANDFRHELRVLCLYVVIASPIIVACAFGIYYFIFYAILFFYSDFLGQLTGYIMAGVTSLYLIWWLWRVLTFHKRIPPLKGVVAQKIEANSTAYTSPLPLLLH